MIHARYVRFISGPDVFNFALKVFERTKILDEYGFREAKSAGYVRLFNLSKTHTAHHAAEVIIN